MAETTKEGSSSTEDPKSPETKEGISKEDLIELIRAVKFKNPDFSQRQVHTEIVTEIPDRFPHYATILNPQSLSLNDVKKAWKKAILRQPPTSSSSSSSQTNNADLAERLKSMSMNPQLYTIGLEGNHSGQAHSMSAARDYISKFLQEEQAENDAKERELLEDYVHVFLDVPADSSVAKKPHQALINFQNSSTKVVKTKKNKKKSASIPIPSAPFENAMVFKIQMAAPMDANDTTKHPMLLYDKTRTHKTFVHPEGALNQHDGYSRLAQWIRAQGVGGALGTAGGTKAYFYGRVTKKGHQQSIVSIYVKELAPVQLHDF